MTRDDKELAQNSLADEVDNLDGCQAFKSPGVGAWSGHRSVLSKGEGAIVIREDAPVYKRPNSTGVAWTLKRANAVAAIEPCLSR